MVDVEADDVALGAEVDDKAVDDLTGLRARRAFQLDIEAVGLRVLMQFHGSFSRKFRSKKKALWTVLPPSSVTTRRTREGE
jgi:hypothetical protein